MVVGLPVQLLVKTVTLSAYWCVFHAASAPTTNHSGMVLCASHTTSAPNVKVILTGYKLGHVFCVIECVH